MAIIQMYVYILTCKRFYELHIQTEHFSQILYLLQTFWFKAINFSFIHSLKMAVDISKGLPPEKLIPCTIHNHLNIKRFYTQLNLHKMIYIHFLLFILNMIKRHLQKSSVYNETLDY